MVSEPSFPFCQLPQCLPCDGLRSISRTSEYTSIQLAAVAEQIPVTRPFSCQILWLESLCYRSFAALSAGRCFKRISSGSRTGRHASWRSPGSQNNPRRAVGSDVGSFLLQSDTLSRLYGPSTSCVLRVWRGVEILKPAAFKA